MGTSSALYRLEPEAYAELAAHHNWQALPEEAPAVATPAAADAAATPAAPQGAQAAAPMDITKAS